MSRPAQPSLLSPPSPPPPSPIALTPRQLLTCPRDPASTPPNLACLLFPRAGAQVRFLVELEGDGTPGKIRLARQPLTFQPARWLPAQSIQLLHTLTSQTYRHRFTLIRRYFFRCPASGCHRRTETLFLFPSHLTYSRGRFLCRFCLRAASSALPAVAAAARAAARAAFPQPSNTLRDNHIYRAARDPFAPGLSLSMQLRALAVWYRYRTEGKGGEGRRWREEWERGEAVPLPSPYSGPILSIATPV